MFLDIFTIFYKPDNVFDQILVRKCWIFCQGTVHAVILRSKWLCNVNVMDGVTTANFYFCCSHHIIKENKYLFYKKTEILLECKVFQKKQIFVDSIIAWAQHSHSLTDVGSWCRTFTLVILTEKILA